MRDIYMYIEEVTACKHITWLRIDSMGINHARNCNQGIKRLVINLNIHIDFTIDTRLSLWEGAGGYR